MGRRWKTAIALLIVVFAVGAVNAVVVGSETRDAEVTIDGGSLLALPAGSAQVVEQGPASPEGDAGLPIVLIHCYGCSLRWWDRLAPALADRHRVVRVDLLGHGGSEKPSSGYSIPDQAALVAAALNRLDVQAATVVGHSMGFTVATALAEQASELVDRLVNIGEGPDVADCSLPFVAGLTYAPGLGPALWRTAPDFAIRDSYGSAFAPGYDLGSGFDDPDQVVDDFRAMTYTAFADARHANDDYRDEAPLDDRVRAAAVPLLSVFGREDQVCDPAGSQAAYETVPGARVEILDGAGHSPNVEMPGETAELIEEFAAEGEVALPR